MSDYNFTAATQLLNITLVSSGQNISFLLYSAKMSRLLDQCDHELSFTGNVTQLQAICYHRLKISNLIIVEANFKTHPSLLWTQLQLDTHIVSSEISVDEHKSTRSSQEENYCLSPRESVTPATLCNQHLACEFENDFCGLKFHYGYAQYIDPLISWIRKISSI